MRKVKHAGTRIKCRPNEAQCAGWKEIAILKPVDTVGSVKDQSSHLMYFNI